MNTFIRHCGMCFCQYIRIILKFYTHALPSYFNPISGLKYGGNVFSLAVSP